MTRDPHIAVHFSCFKCGLSYMAIQEKVPEARAGRFDCMACRTKVLVWSGIYDFTGWKPVWADAGKIRAAGRRKLCPTEGPGAQWSPSLASRAMLPE
jgi:hypothetical protein